MPSKKKSMATIESKHEISKHAIDTCTGILKNLLFPSIHILLVMPTWFQVCLLNQNWSWTRNDNWGNGSLWPTTLDALRSYKRPKTKLGAFKWYNPGTHITGWWFQSPWKILVNWDDYSQYMENKKCSKPPTRSSLLLVHVAPSHIEKHQPSGHARPLPPHKDLRCSCSVMRDSEIRTWLFV